ncbi:MAG: hypothetical protein QM503_04955 [Bacteroidota bacterium]
MKLKKKFVLVLLLILASIKQYGHDIETNWKLAKQSDDIEISYRNVTVGDTLETRQMKITFVVSSDTETILEMFKDSEKLSVWTIGTEECKVLAYKTDNLWMTYTLYNIPWPFNQRDLVTKYELIKRDSITLMKLTSVPHQLPLYHGISRLDKFEGSWIFTNLSNGTTKVEFISLSFAKPIIPRFIKDPIIQSMFIDSVVELKHLLKQQDIAKA